MARSTSDPDQEYIYFMGSETLPSACYILSDESRIPFYSTSNGYNYKLQSFRIILHSLCRQCNFCKFSLTIYQKHDFYNVQCLNKYYSVWHVHMSLFTQ